MEKVLINTIEDVMESIEDVNYDAYVYENQKFHIIDNSNNINFQAKLGYNNYYFKDNISGLSFMKTKKYLNDETTIKQMLIEENDEKCFYSYLERNGNIKLVIVARTSGDGSLMCANYNVLNKSWEEIMEYANDVFEDYNNLDDIPAEKLEIYEDDENIDEIEDKLIRDAFCTGKRYDQDDEGYEYDEDETEVDDDEYEYDDETQPAEEKYRFEFNQIEENQRYGLSDLFEDNTIGKYEKYAKAKEDDDDNSEQENMEYLEEIYEKFKVTINKKEVDGVAKYRIIGDCDAALDQKTFDSILFDNAVERLKAVLDALKERDTVEKNNDLEK